MPEAQASRTPTRTPDILERIVATKRVEVERLRARLGELQRSAASAPPARDFEGSLRSGSTVSLIAEVKRHSPGAGAIRPDLDPSDLARSYEVAGARAVSVLTDVEYFHGSLADLTTVHGAVNIPVLRKDFVVSEAQVWESRAAGADAILLIVRILSDAELRALRELAEELGMSALVEAHDVVEARRALGAGARIVGVNNRDLATFATSLDTTLSVAAEVPDDVLLVSESGIRQVDDVRRLASAGVGAILVGEALLRAPSPEEKARELGGVGRNEVRS